MVPRVSFYPAAPRGDDADQLFGHTVADPYRALEDPDAPETVTWSKAQDQLFNEHRARWSTRDHVAARLTELLAAGSVGTPIWRGERAFHTRRTAKQEHAVLLTTDPDPNTAGAERVLIDPIAVDPSGATTLDTWQPSKDGTVLAYQLSEGGTEESMLRVMDVASGADVDGPIDRARYSPVAWLPDNSAFYYVRRLPPDQVPENEQQYHRRVYLHRLGSNDDIEIHGAGLDKTNYYGVSVSRDGRWLIVTASQGTAPRDDVWIADITADPATPALVPVMIDVDAQASLHVGRDGRLYVWTDLDAPRGRLAVADPAAPAPENWYDLVPEDHEAVLEDFAILDDLDEPVLAVSWTRHALAEVSTHDLATGARTGTLDLPGLGTIGGLVERPEGGHEMWFAYTDHSTPVKVLRYDARGGALDLWAESPGTVDVPAVSSQQVVYTSKDGTEVRMVIIAPAGASPGPRNPRPTVLYGYGGFNVAQTPAYSASILSWVESGGVWAIAGLRGGSEEGEAWHRAGMRENKQNVFDDFHAAAEYLIGEGWTTPDTLGIMGGSNGGLLVGAVLTQRPELFRAVVCSAPLLDMVRYEQFGLGATWNDEFGTAAVPDELEWLLGYSPYHHVSDGTSYPAVLFTIFDGDTRVDTMHARKMCAALQAATAGTSYKYPILLRAEKNVGHGGRAVSRTVDLAADQLAFFDHHLGGGS